MPTMNRYQRSITIFLLLMLLLPGCHPSSSLQVTKEESSTSAKSGLKEESLQHDVNEHTHQEQKVSAKLPSSPISSVAYGASAWREYFGGAVD